ncbi:hypothetical protein [Fructilactobacillus frigidiflavus]
MIQQQINNLIEGNYAESLLNKVKTSLISGYLTNFDSERKSLNDLFIKALVNQPVSKNEWISNVKAIDKADIAAVARKLVLKSVFLLKGENDE